MKHLISQTRSIPGSSRRRSARHGVGSGGRICSASNRDSGHGAGPRTGSFVSLFLLVWLAFSAAPTQAEVTLGTSTRTEGPAAGNDSVILATQPGTPWTANANATWLHLNLANQSGSCSTNVLFSYDANPGATRTGTLTIAGQTLTITQAGSTYTAVTALTTLASQASGLSAPVGLAVDGADNVYIEDDTPQGGVIYELPAGSTSLTTLANTSSGLAEPIGLAVDAAGNVFLLDYDYDPTGPSVKELPAGSAPLTPLTVLSQFFDAEQAGALAVDFADNLYLSVADRSGVFLEELPAHSTLNTPWTTLANANSGLVEASDMAVDVAGDVYITDTDRAVEELPGESAPLTPLITLANYFSPGVAVDGAGNVYIADVFYANNSSNNSVILKFPAGSTPLSPLVTAISGLDTPVGLVADSAGDLFINDSGETEYANNPVIEELPHAFVDLTPKVESPGGGIDSLPVVLPATANLSGPFAPASDQSWLIINHTAGGVVSFSCTPNTGPARTGRITLLGQTLPVTQSSSSTFTLGATIFLEGIGQGNDSVTLTVSSPTGTWTASASSSDGAGGTWLHITSGTSGTGSATVTFTFAANLGVTRAGTLTIAGQTVTVTQAGYPNPTAVVGLFSQVSPNGLAVDSQGNVYVADGSGQTITEWVPASGMVNTLAIPGLGDPMGVAVDRAGNLYIADGNNGVIYEVPANELPGGGPPTLLVGGLTDAAGVAVDSQGDLFITDSGAGKLLEWVPSSPGATTGILTTLASGLNNPVGVAVDSLGNVYVANSGANSLVKWTLSGPGATTGVLSLLASDLNDPTGVAVDSAGVVFIADTGDSAIYTYTPGGNSAVYFAADPDGLAVDSAGDLYFSDNSLGTVEEIPNVLVNTTTKWEPPAAGSDSLSPVAPASANLSGLFAPASDQSWLTITGTAGGVVSFAFQVNDTGTNRMADISLLGQTISVVQLADLPSLAITQVSPNSIVVSWPATGSFGLEQTTDLASGSWSASSYPISTSNGINSITFTPPAGSLFFRLAQ